MSEELALAVKLGLLAKVMDPVWKPVATELGDILATPLRDWAASRKAKAASIGVDGVQLLVERNLEPVCW